MTYRAIVALNLQLAIKEIFDNPTLDKGRVLVFQPQVRLAGEVILAFNAIDCRYRLLHFLGLDESWSEGSCDRTTAPVGV